jgi:hypothetical protein
MWEMKCPFCYRSTVGWPHVIFFTVFAAAITVYFVKFF